MRQTMMSIYGNMKIPMARFLLWTIASVFLSMATSQMKNQGSISEATSLSDWNQEITCKGILPEPRCQCSDTSVSCINARLLTPNKLSIMESFPRLTRLTLHGNNFVQLPERAFTDGNSLKTLNLSANYLVTFHPGAFAGLSTLETLDLSENEIILNDTMKELFSPLRKLKELYLRRAFRQSTNSRLEKDSPETQMQRLEGIFQGGKLEELELLDLSMNAFSFIRPSLFCSMKNLTRISLAWNNLKRLELDLRCLRNVKVLDLRDNQFVALDGAFFRLAAHSPASSIRLVGNPFECYCNLSSYHSWLNSTDKVADKVNLTCDKALPRVYAKHQILKVPPEKLQCPKASTNGANDQNRFLLMIIKFILLIILV